MKILYVITGLAQGGAERVVCDLADKMFVKGHTVKIAYLTGEIITKPIHEEINLVKLGLNNLVSLTTAYIKLAKIIRSYQPDVVHAHMVHANLLSRLVRLTTPMSKLITTAHNSNEGGVARMLAYRVTHNLADVTTNVSQEATLAFEQKGAVPKGSMQAIYNGINLDKYYYHANAKAALCEELNLNKDIRIILSVGRFSDQKDYPNLLRAIHLLKKDIICPFKLVIAGEGTLRRLIENMIDDLELRDEVILLGSRDDIAELMSAADLFVLSSKFEGFGLVVAEAMACECLVVATDCGGVAEVLNNVEFLVPINNAAALKDKINDTLNTEESKKEIVIHKNLQHVKNCFSLENTVKKWTVLYNEK